MALFFFGVGLELKREVLVGEPVAPRQALFPITGAVGGMIVLIAIDVALNLKNQSLNG